MNKGGGLVLLVNNRWCSPGHVTTQRQLSHVDAVVVVVVVSHVTSFVRHSLQNLGHFNSIALTSHLTAQKKIQEALSLFVLYANVNEASTASALSTDQIMIWFFLQSSSKACGRGRLVATGSVRN